MEKKHHPLIYFVIFFVLLALVGYLVKSTQKIFQPNLPIDESLLLENDTIKKFASDTEFTALMTSGQNNSSFGLPVTGGGVMMKSVARQMSVPSAETADRSSSTNVQVVGIDEPDIVKTDGSSIFYSKEGQYRYIMNRTLPMGIEVQSVSAQKMMPPQYEQTSEILTVGALPPSQMKIASSIPQKGEMLISGKVLVVFTTNSTNGSLQLVGYSIANPNEPKKLWELPFTSRSQKIAARLYDDSLYLVTSTSPTLPRPCPVPLIEGKTGLSVRCTDIYMPSSRPASDAVYSILRINPQTGRVAKSASFVGQTGQSTVYMSHDYIYLSYHVAGNSINILNRFITENKGMLPQYIEDKIKKLNEYDLSQSTKEIEMNSLLSLYFNGMDGDERLTQENQLNNAFKRFFRTYKRSFEATGIVKIDNDDLSILTTGKVPGVALNQFSFDEWNGDLRVATTIAGTSPLYMLGGNTNAEQVSDVYILGRDLRIKGSVKDLGKTERIYSVRFIEDRGYVVTFRQTDPFYVLDLSNANAPQVKGELKIPGYSSYLHPLDTHLILGIGRENQAKLSLFDVSDPTEPKEISRYDLAGEYSSEAMDNHHAFLQDPKYKIFFIPGSRGGYIFSYKNQSLSLLKAVESSAVKRGLYLNDYFYIVTDAGVMSFKEQTWSKVGEVAFEQKKNPESVLPVSEPPVVINEGESTGGSPPGGAMDYLIK